MAALEILEYPDQRLRETSKQVAEFDSGLGQLVDDLIETLYTTNAIALSAPQLNDHRQVLVVDLSEDRSDPKVYINPEIISKKAWGFVEESCLSLPGITGSVVRATELRVRAHDRTGEVFERDLSGMDAVCLQHEIDHFAGKLFIDRLFILRRLYLKVRAKFGSRGSSKT